MSLRISKNINHRELPTEEFTKLTGVTPQDFEVMLQALREECEGNDILKIKSSSMNIEEILLLTIEHIGGRDTLTGLVQKYDTNPTYAYKVINQVVSILCRKRLSLKLPLRKYKAYIKGKR